MLKSKQPTAIYCSPLSHAVATIAPLFSDEEIEADIQYCSWLKEVDTGDWEGLNYAQVTTQFSRGYLEYLQNPREHQFPRGERLVAAYERASEKFRELVLRETGRSERLVFVGHPMINRLILTDYCGASLEDHRHIEQPPGQFTVIRCAYGQPELQSIGSAVV